MPDSPADLTSYLEDVWHLTFRLLGNAEDARECCQQTFADALNIDSTTVRNWRALLYRVATRRAMDVLRQRYRDRASLERLETDPVRNDPPESDLDYRELCYQVRQSMATIPAIQAEAFWLRHIEQWSIEEISRELQVEQGYVRVLVHRAVMHLRQSLDSDYGELLASREPR